MNFVSLQFLADENIYPLLISWMKENGYALESIKELGFAGMDDYRILS